MVICPIEMVIISTTPIGDLQSRPDLTSITTICLEMPEVGLEMGMTPVLKMMKISTVNREIGIGSVMMKVVNIILNIYCKIL